MKPAASLAALVSSNYFDTLGVRLAAGRTFTPEEERPGAGIPVAIATYTRWQKEQLDPAFVGRTIRINARDFTVVGIAPEGFTGTMALVSADVYLPLGMFDTVVSSRPAVGFVGGSQDLGNRSNHSLAVAGRLKPGLTDAFVSSRLEAVSRQLEAAYPAENKDQLLSVTPLPRMSNSSTPDSDTALGTLSALLLGLSGVVLVIACLNVANMLLARGAARSKELAVRLALGARRARIVRQLLTEGILLAAGGAGLGLVLSYWATRALATSLMSAFPYNLSLNATPDIRVLAATLGFAALSTIAFGLGPALRLSRRDLVADLKDRGGEGASTGRRFGARNLMVIGQVALSLGLLTAGGIFARTAITASGGNPGYSYDRLLLASLDNSLGGFDETRGRAIYGAVLDRVRSLPGVSTVSMTSTLPFGDTQQSAAMERVGVSGKEPARARTYRVIGADHFAALGLRDGPRPRVHTGGGGVGVGAACGDHRRGPGATALRGRGPDRPDDPRRRRRRAIPSRRAVSRCRSSASRRRSSRSCSIARRFPTSTCHSAATIAPACTSRCGSSRAPTSSRASTRSARAIRATEPRLPVLTLSTMQAFHDKGLELWALRTGAQLFTALGGLALLLAVVGVYGVKSYIVSQRTREIGIRMALGASARDVVGLVLRDGFFLTGAGVALGVPLAILVSFALAAVFVDVGGFDGLVVSVATIVLAVSATIASAVPARRASRVQPLRALQGD